MTVGMHVGDSVTVTLVDGLTRTQIVQYAGASGDFNPLHTDEVFAIGAAGKSTVIAHGMLTMGLVGAALCDLVDQDRVTSFGGRFKLPVLPGDALTVNVTASTGESPGTLAFTLVAQNQAGDEVFSGYASVSDDSSSVP